MQSTADSSAWRQQCPCRSHHIPPQHSTDAPALWPAGSRGMGPGLDSSRSGLNVGCMQGKKPKIPEFPVPPDQEEEPEEKQCRAALHAGAPEPLWDACSSALAAPACCAAQRELFLQKQSWLLCRPPKIFHLPVAACSPAVSLIWQHPYAEKNPTPACHPTCHPPLPSTSNTCSAIASGDSSS